MSIMPAGPIQASEGLGALLARLAGGQPMLPALSSQFAAGPGGGAAAQGMPLPAPVPRIASAGPGSGGIAAGPRVDEGPGAPGALGTPSVMSAESQFAPPHRSRGQIIAGILADGFAGALGQPGRVAERWERERQEAAQLNREEVRWHRDREAKREDQMRPRVEQVGDALGYLDPTAHTFQPFYQKPQAFEAYAQARGFKAGTPEYAQAVEDYRLGGWSDPAVQNRSDVEDMRARGRNALEIMRGANRLRDTETRMATSRENSIRSTGTSRENNIRSTGTSAANNMRTTTNQRGIADQRDVTTRRGQDLRSQLRGKHVGGRPVADSEPIARDAQGRPLVVRDGKWVPAS